ncbi:RNA-binding protein [archaeon]|jgi:RNA recognition motif-containing protein|nr:RNA-binding protein [archaeon]
MKLYVGNLPWSIDDKGLSELFASYGDIEEAVLIKDKFSGRSKGFGFVTFTDDGAAQKAIDEMNKKEVEGRPLTVSEAKPMVPRDNAPRYNDRDNSEPSEAPVANPSEINSNVEDALDDEAAPEVVDDNSDAEEGEEKIETVEEAKEDAEEAKSE